MNELERLQSHDVQERAEAAESLSQMGPDAAFASVDLVKGCGDDDRVSASSVAALEEMGPPPVESVPELAVLAGSIHPLVAYWAITLLGRCGDAAQVVEPELAAILQASKENSVQQRAAWALGEIGATSDVAIAALEDAIKSSDARLSRLATTSLEKSRS